MKAVAFIFCFSPFYIFPAVSNSGQLQMLSRNGILKKGLLPQVGPSGMRRMFKPDSGILRLRASNPGVEPFLSVTDIVPPLKSHLGQESLPIVCETKCLRVGVGDPDREADS